MSITKFQPIRGFRDLYPEDKAVQNYIFGKIRETARIFGFEQYDGPILEPIELYLGKTSRELIERQTFQIRDKKDTVLVMRPEMTPSLARMVAQKEQQLIFPLRLFNLGVRFRYETPQKGREREFYQADFDLLGPSGTLADAEILNALINLFLRFGATDKDFVVYVNSRDAMRKMLAKLAVAEENIKDVIAIIDKKEKVDRETFIKMISDVKDVPVDKIMSFLENPSDYEHYFEGLKTMLDMYDIGRYIKINPSIVRGLDYYTGLVFEVKENGGMTRSLAGGGRYDNLIENFGAQQKISGVGFATSDVILWEFLKDKQLLPDLSSNPTRVLITIFADEKPAITRSLEIAQQLRKRDVPCEIYPEAKKLDKQLKYADRKKIPYVVIIGPDEVKNNMVVLKNLRKNTQETLPQKDLIKKILS